MLLRFLGKNTVQPPAALVQAAKQPEAAAFCGFYSVVITANATLSPPAGLNPFRTPMTRDVMFVAEIIKADRWAVGCDRHDFQHVRRIQ